MYACAALYLSLCVCVCVLLMCVLACAALPAMCAFVTLSLASLSPCHSPNPPRPCFSCLFLPLSSPFSHSLSPCRPGTRFIRFSPVFVGQLIRPLIDEFPSVKLHLPRKWTSLPRCAILQNCNMHNKSRTMSAFGVIANVALLPRQINPFTSVSTDWLSHRYNTSSLSPACRTATSNAASFGRLGLVPSCSLSTWMLPSTFFWRRQQTGPTSHLASIVLYAVPVLVVAGLHASVSRQLKCRRVNKNRDQHQPSLLCVAVMRH